MSCYRRITRRPNTRFTKKRNLFNIIFLIADETLITVTADHSHVFTIGAYPKRGNPIFSIVREVDGNLAVGSDNKTYTSLGYANGRSGLRGPRPDLRGVDTTNKDYRQQATVLRRSETHGTEDVGK